MNHQTVETPIRSRRAGIEAPKRAHGDTAKARGLRTRRMGWAVASAAGISILASAAGCGKSASEMFRRDNPNKAAEERWKRVRAGVKRQLAESQLKNGHVNEALREAEEAIALDPANAPGFVLLARIRLEQGRLAAARQAAEEAVTLAPDSGEAAATAGLVAERCEQWEEAERHYARACAASPREAEYIESRAMALVALGRAVEGLDWIESSQDRCIDDPRLRAASARIYRHLGMHEAAAQRLQLAARLSDDDAAIKAELGMSLSSARRDVEAVGILTPLLESGKAGGDAAESRAATLSLAQSQFRLGKHAAARKTLDCFVKGQREDAAAWLLLSRVACEQRDWRMARQAAEEAIRLRGDSAEPHLLRAVICLQQMDGDEALASARLAIQRGPRDATSYCLLGQGFELRGEAALARAAYFDALTHEPDCVLARGLLEKLGPADAAGDEDETEAAHKSAMAHPADEKHEETFAP